MHTAENTDASPAGPAGLEVIQQGGAEPAINTTPDPTKSTTSLRLAGATEGVAAAKAKAL